ncbi:MAG: exostosin family protein [Ectothiorhodospiraceae bacterium]|nr:exostosin family protein [Chromatiales bacterium]MCP5154832.1 exostosin family protein [Ectothiorhodospiraceae bacterium]
MQRTREPDAPVRSRLVVLPLETVQSALDRAAARLHGSPAGVAPWHFDGAGLGTAGGDWREADRIVVPVAFNALGTQEWRTVHGMTPAAAETFFAEFDRVSRDLLETLPSYRARPRAHVFVQWGDLEWDLPCLTVGRVLKVSASRRGAAEAMPYFVDDLEEGEAARLPAGPIAHAGDLCGFVGNLDSHPLRRRLAAAIERIDPTGSRVRLRHTEVGPADARRDRYLRALGDARFVLCPRGGGLNSARFFETLALGRIPVLVADDTRLPLESTIPYREFVVRLPEDDLDSLLARIAAFERQHELEHASRLARGHYWRCLRFRHFFARALARDG